MGVFYSSFSMPRTDLLGALSVRWIQPTQQQGLRLPSRSSSQVRVRRRFLVLICFAFSTQQINSLRARGVMSSQRALTLRLLVSASLRSAGILCTVPPGICSCVMHLLYNLKRLSFATRKISSLIVIPIRLIPPLEAKKLTQYSLFKQEKRRYQLMKHFVPAHEPWLGFKIPVGITIVQKGNYASA